MTPLDDEEGYAEPPTEYELNQPLVDKFIELIAPIDPTIDWSLIHFVGHGANQFIAIEHTDAETEAKLQSAFQKLSDRSEQTGLA